MKHINYKLLFFVLLAFNLLKAQQPKKLKVLFLGNSYTQVNNLPALIQNIALANGDSLVFESNCPGGQTFQGHCSNSTSISLINSKAWDHVILQAQSQEPSFSPNQVKLQTLPYAIKLDSIIKHNNACTESVFYETWGRKYGDASNCGSYPPICTYTGMQNRLRASYKLFADTTDATLAPAGEAFRRSIALNPTLELYNPDQSHPSLEGSYLVACVFYEVLFHKSVLNNTYVNGGMTTTNISFLQQVAHSVVNDSLTTWNIGKYFPWAPFTSTYVGSLNYQFTSQSPSLNNTWYFGDGTISTLNNPTHNYASAQTYTVSHVVYNSCKKDSVLMVLNAMTSGLHENPQDDLVSVYPIPANDLLHIKTSTNQIYNYSIYDDVGKQHLSGKTSDIINIAPLQSGVYFIKVETENKPLTLKFTKHD